MLAIPEADRAQGECGACAGGTLAAAVQGGCRSWNVSYDIPYLVALIGAASAKANINPAAVFVAGIDDGADMGFALACAHPELITGVFSINGATPPTCAALTTSVDPVSVLSVSAAAAAASKPEPAPAALASAQAWASRMGCAAAPVNGTALTELRHGPFFNGADSADSDWSAGCAPGSAVRLISVASLPEQTTDSTFTASFVTDSLAWLFAHPRGGAPPPPPALSPPPVAAVLSGNSSARRHAPPPPPHPPLVNASAHPILARIFGEDPAVASPPSPPRALPPPSLLARLRAAAESRNGHARAPAPAPMSALKPRAAQAPAPAPAPSSTDAAVSALSGPPSSATPSPPAAAAPPMTSAQLMAILSDPVALKSLIGDGLAANTAIPADLKAMLGEPAVQAVLQAAEASPDPGAFLMNALSAAGIDISTLLGGAVAPAPAPMAGRDLSEGAASGASSVVGTLAAVGAALAALLVIV